jgi:hypothetical protein
MTMTKFAPPSLIIELAPGTHIRREPTVTPRLPIVGNGPPGTFAIFPSGRKISLPTDQIVLSEPGVAGAGARVSFGGMAFEGLRDDTLVFRRVFDVLPPERVSPERSRRMTLEPSMVTAIYVDGEEVWPLAS